MALWDHANTQWRAGGLGIIGIDFLAVEKIAGVLGIEFNCAMLRKIRTLELFELSRIRD
jgi:hypothetical protein